jgi:hypothetical protein
MMPAQGKHSVDGTEPIFPTKCLITKWNAAASAAFLGGRMGL